LLDLLLKQPIVNIRIIQDHLACTFTPASKVTEQLTQIGLLKEITGNKRNRFYRYEPYLKLFDEDKILGNGAIIDPK